MVLAYLPKSTKTELVLVCFNTPFSTMKLLPVISVILTLAVMQSCIKAVTHTTEPEVITVDPVVQQVEPVAPQVAPRVYPPYAIALYHDGTTKTFTEQELGNSVVWECQAETEDPSQVRVYSTQSSACIETSIDSSSSVKQAVLGFRASQ